ncbi:hypothetical protein JG688_00016005 [Phytophthora aleatoria]|uniref:Uncharacterized protein n=1 Tax=Phytophthora aleatoria TaxID=2496075 RepID=A0A8J5MCP3_9STRA|nr:hypothetical protein JG688_00016005 [Phytophthora aleatoria]
MAQLFVSADVMGISSREVIGLRSMEREFRKELGRKQDRKLHKSILGFIGLPSAYGSFPWLTPFG